MARPKRRTPIRKVADSVEQLEIVETWLKEAFPDLRKVPVDRREDIKIARASLAQAQEHLRQLLEKHALAPASAGAEKNGTDQQAD